LSTRIIITKPFGQLSKRYEQALVLRYWHGQSVAMIAAYAGYNSLQNRAIALVCYFEKQKLLSKVRLQHYACV